MAALTPCPPGTPPVLRLCHRGYPDWAASCSPGGGYHTREVESFGNLMLDAEAN
jgi:hypothetical protein